MTNFVAIRDGGKTSENGAMRLWRKVSSNGQGPVGQSDCQVTQTGSPSTSVLIATGDIMIPYQEHIFHGWVDAAVTTSALSSNATGSSRIDSVVAYVDLAVVSSASNNNPGALKFLVVAGTTSAPSGATIQAAVGAGNPYYILANVTVANGFPTSPTTITNANITDSRTRFLLGNSGSLPPFAVAGTLVVTNDLSPRWIVPPGVSAINRLDATCITAPTGSGLTLRLYNVTQTREVGTVTISAGSTTANNSSMTNSGLATGDVIRFDCTAIGSTVPGADVTVQPSA
jgi:hypothetical protein